jgi:hypothetical protein
VYYGSIKLAYNGFGIIVCMALRAITNYYHKTITQGALKDMQVLYHHTAVIWVKTHLTEKIIIPAWWYKTCI